MRARYILIACVFCWCHRLVAQVSTDIVITDYGCKGNLTKCLDALAIKSGLTINFKSSLTEKRRLLLTTKDYKLSYILSEIENQCDIGYTTSEENILLYEKQGKFVYGTVRDAFSSEPLSMAQLIVNGSSETITTDEYGMFRFFSFDNPLRIEVIHPDYQILTTEIDIRNQYINLRLLPISELDPVEVAQSDQALSLKPFDEVVPNENTLPSPGGELDALNAVKVLPGVGNTTLSDQGLVIRGGSPDQNFTLLDGIPVYNNYHLLGLFSIFNSSNISSINVHKDAFPSKYNNRLSSVLQVNLEQGNKTKLETGFDIGILSSGLSINGPIIKEKLSFSLSARRTYADLLTTPILWLQNQDKSRTNTTSLWAYDVYGKLHWQINEKNDISCTAYNGGDQLNLKNTLRLDDEEESTERTKGAIGWRNKLIGIKWRSNLSNVLFLNSEVSTSNYQMTFEDEYDFRTTSTLDYSNASFSNGLTENRAGVDMQWAWNKRNFLHIGVGRVNYSFMPLQRSYSRIAENFALDTSLVYDQISSNEGYLFAENRAYFQGGNITYGLRASVFRVRNQTYRRFQPKLLLIQNLNETNQLRFSLATSHQFIHLVPNNTLGFPIDVWLPVTDEILPMSVTQLSTRFVKKSKYWYIQLAVFSKFYNSVLEYEAGAQTLIPSSWESELRAGSGRAAGIENTISYKREKWSVYSAYTFARSRRTISEINDGIEYFSKYDRPHVYSLVTDYEINKRDKLTLSWSYASGNPITVPTARYVVEINGKDIILEEFGELNNYRLPAIHHLDIAYIHTRKHRKFESVLTLGVYNLYNRFNPYMLFAGIDEDGSQTYKIRSYLPILPIVKYQVKL